jgi:aspartyl-tRNA(Asn)/glutamyl-tRNA(Gln) amidotransferase subunit C
MSKITVREVKKLAEQSAILISDEEANNMALELKNILEYVAQLDEVDGGNLEPTYQVTGLENVMRPDEIIEYNVSREQLLFCAPEVQDGQIKVPKVF